MCEVCYNMGVCGLCEYDEYQRGRKRPVIQEEEGWKIEDDNFQWVSDEDLESEA